MRSSGRRPTKLPNSAKYASRERQRQNALVWPSTLVSRLSDRHAGRNGLWGCYCWAKVNQVSIPFIVGLYPSPLVQENLQPSDVSFFPPSFSEVFAFWITFRIPKAVYANSVPWGAYTMASSHPAQHRTVNTNDIGCSVRSNTQFTLFIT